MHTRTLYYEDCHLSHFTATVTGCEPGKGGYLVTLEQMINSAQAADHQENKLCLNCILTKNKLDKVL